MNTTDESPEQRNGDGGEARVEVKRVVSLVNLWGTVLLMLCIASVMLGLGVISPPTFVAGTFFPAVTALIATILSS